MQQLHIPPTIQKSTQGANGVAPPGGLPKSGQLAAASAEQDAVRAAERARLRQGVMHVRIRHFYCTLEEMFDPSLRGQPFVVGTGMGRPNERSEEHTSELQ